MGEHSTKLPFWFTDWNLQCWGGGECREMNWMNHFNYIRIIIWSWFSFTLPLLLAAKLENYYLLKGTKCILQMELLEFTVIMHLCACHHWSVHELFCWLLSACIASVMQILQPSECFWCGSHALSWLKRANNANPASRHGKERLI